MRILVICPHYAPDTAPTGVVMTEIAEQLIELGHELHIVTSLPFRTRLTCQIRCRCTVSISSMQKNKVSLTLS